MRVMGVEPLKMFVVGTVEPATARAPRRRRERRASMFGEERSVGETGTEPAGVTVKERGIEATQAATDWLLLQHFAPVQ